MKKAPHCGALVFAASRTRDPAAHRAEAFAACRYLIEELKTRAPFWKRETVGGGARWVEHNTPG